MTNGGNTGSGSVAIVAIVAILLLVGAAAWFVWGRSGGSRSVHRTTVGATSQPAGKDSL